MAKSVGRGEVQKWRAMTLRNQGLKHVEIAAEMGISEGYVSKLLSEARKPLKDYNTYLFDMLDRCERLMEALEDGISAGDPRSVDSATRLVDRIAKLLGLDHKDRMNERTVRVQEAQARLVGFAVAKMLDHLEITGDRRTEAVEVLQGELEDSEMSL